MRRIIGLVIAIIGFAGCIAETIYFGWNFTPQTSTEKFLDTLCAVLFLVGVILFIISPKKESTEIVSSKTSIKKR
jgi:hypothetical protein